MDEHDKKYLAIQNNYVVKSNDLIQKSRFKLSLTQQKVVLYLCSQIDPKDEDFHLYTIPIREFCQLCGIDGVGGRQYKAIQTTLEQLRQKSYIIRLTEHRSTSVSWVNKWWLDTSAGVQSVQIWLDPDMKPYLLRLKDNYTKYEYAYTLRMTHKATPRLYEILKSYHYDKTKPYDKAFSIEELRQLLDADDKESYKQFKYFRAVVLEPSIKEINEQTDISVSIKPKKQGRNVVEVAFHIEPKKAADLLEAVGTTYQTFGYDYVGSSQKDTPDYKRKKPKKPRKQRKKPIKESIQPEEIPLESSENTLKMDAGKPLQEHENSPAEQHPEPQPVPEDATAAAEEQKPKRIQIRIFVDGKLFKSPSKAPDERQQLEEQARKILAEYNLEPIDPDWKSHGVSFRLNCKK